MNIRMQRNCLVAALCLLALRTHPPMGPEGPGGPAERHRERRPVNLNAVQLPRLELVQDNGWSKNLETDESTRVHQGRRELRASDLKPGMRVHERDHWNGRAYLADDIDVCAGIHTEGELVEWTREHLVVRRRDGSLLWARLKGDVRVHSHFFPTTLEGARAGEHVVLDGEQNGDFKAAEVEFPDRAHPIAWLSLPAGLALLGWSWRFGRKLRR